MHTTTSEILSPPQITLEILKSHHVEGAIACIADTFAAGEPMAQHLGISQSELTQFVRLLISKAAHEGLSVVALDEGQAVIGATIAEDYLAAPPDGLDTISDKFTPIFALLGTLSERYIASQKVQPGTHCHIFMCGVYRQYAHRQLGRKMALFAQDVALERKFTTVVCEATGLISQFMCSKIGFEYVDEINYQDFCLHGQAVFAGITSVDSCIVYHKSL